MQSKKTDFYWLGLLNKKHFKKINPLMLRDKISHLLAALKKKYLKGIQAQSHRISGWGGDFTR